MPVNIGLFKKFKMPAVRRSTLAAFLPAALSLVYVFIVSLLTSAVQMKSAVLTAHPVELAGRLRWGASASILAIAIVCTAAMAAVVIRKRLTRPWFLASLIIAAIFVAVITWRGGAYAGLAGTKLVEDLESHTSVRVRAVLTYLNAGTVVVGVFLLAAVVALGRGGESISIEDLASRQLETRWLLYLASTELVIGVAEIHLLYEWAIRNPWLQSPAPQQALSQAIVSASGALYTVLLLLLFIPLELRYSDWCSASVGT